MSTSRHTAATRWVPWLAASASASALAIGLALGLAALPTLAQPDAGYGAHRGGHAHHGMRGMHEMGGMGGMGGLFNPRLLDRVGATEEQKSQLRQIMASAHADVRALRDSGADQREQARGLFTQPNVDARAAEALRQQMMARQDQASRRMMQAALDASRVLTPDQRQQLSALSAQHRAERAEQREKMRQHRAERGHGPHSGARQGAGPASP